MILILFYALLMPVSAVLAGPVIWAIYRDETLEDTALVRNFVFVMVLFMALGYGLGRTKKIHMMLDPVFRIQTQIDENPVYTSMTETSPSDALLFRGELIREMAQGATIEQALLLTRSEVSRRAGQRLPWAGQDAKIEWARMTVDSLRELKARDPVECYRAVAHAPLSAETLTYGFSAQNSAAFRFSLTSMLAAASAGMSRRELAPGDVKVNFDELQKAGRDVFGQLTERFGKEVSDSIYQHRFKDLPPDEASAMCSATIYFIDTALKLPKGVAASLTSEVLRVY